MIIWCLNPLVSNGQEQNRRRANDICLCNVLCFQTDDEVDWPVLKPDIFASIMDFFASNVPILTEDQPASDTGFFFSYCQYKSTSIPLQKLFSCKLLATLLTIKFVVYSTDQIVSTQKCVVVNKIVQLIFCVVGVTFKGHLDKVPNDYMKQIYT